MTKIEHSIEISSTRDVLWEIMSDVDNEAEYWYGTKSVSNISKQGNEIEREITQNFRNHKIKQRVVLHPKDSVDIQYLKGLTEGVKILTIDTLEENKQRLKAFWDIRFPGIFRLTTPMLRSHVEKGTVEALKRIKDAAETKNSAGQQKVKEELRP